jgi:hypothetical protein
MDAPRCPQVKTWGYTNKARLRGLGSRGSRSQVQPGNEKQRLRLLLQDENRANFQNVEYISVDQIKPAKNTTFVKN